MIIHFSIAKLHTLSYIYTIPIICTKPSGNGKAQLLQSGSELRPVVVSVVQNDMEKNVPSHKQFIVVVDLPHC